MTMRKVSPQEMLNHVVDIERMVEGLNGKYVAVGLPKETVAGKIHGTSNGRSRTIVENAMVHEFGSADGRIPERSMLRMPFKVREKELGARVLKEFSNFIIENKNIDTVLGRIGVAAVNIVKEAFRTGGFGKWKKLDPATVKRKGFTDILENSRVTRNSMTWVVRND